MRLLRQNWAVLIEGKGYLLQFDGYDGPVEAGFFIEVVVRARTSAAAYRKAVNRVRRIERLEEMMREPNPNTPKLFLDRMVELGKDDGHDRPKGFIFYSKEEPSQRNGRTNADRSNEPD